MQIRTPSFLKEAWEKAKTVPSWIIRQIERIPTEIRTGTRTPGGWLEPRLSASISSIAGSLLGVPLPYAEEGVSTARAAEQIVSTAGVAPSAGKNVVGAPQRASEERIAPTQIPKAEERTSAGPQIVASIIPGQVSPTPVMQKLSTPTTPTSTPATPEKISPLTPSISPISPTIPAPTPTPTRITTGLTPPTGPTGAGIIPPPVVPSAIVQREQVGAPSFEE